jgi:IS5 family transposase
LYPGGILTDLFDRTDGPPAPCSGIDTPGPTCSPWSPQLDLRFEPQLEQLDRLLDDDELFEAVRADLARRSPRSQSRGLPSTPVEVILRMLVVMRLYGWSYAQAEYFVHDSLVPRQFCRVYFERVPDDTTLIRWANTIGSSPGR